MNPDYAVSRPVPRLRIRLLAITLARLVLNTSHRMVYPFLPTFARGLGVDLQAIAWIVTARSGLGLVSPIFGSLADRHGRKQAMIAALLALAAGMALVGLWPSYPALFAGLLLAMVAKLIYDPAIQAYIGDQVAYAKRGLVIALAELSWSGAFLVAVPFIGWLIDRTGHWHAPFPWLAGFAVLGAVVLWRVVPPEGGHAVERPALVRGIRLVLGHRAAVAGLTASLLISLGNEVIGIVYGAWMEEAFGLKVAALGAASAVIGFAELGGEGLVAGWVDRLGKRRAAVFGLGLNAGCCLLLPILGFSVGGALVGLFLFYITFEFGLVSTLPLMTELVPGARATLMAGNVAALSVGRMLGAQTGPALFNWGLEANGITAAVVDLLVVFILIAWVRQE